MRVESARMHVVSVDGVIISAQAKGLATVLRVCCTCGWRRAAVLHSLRACCMCGWGVQAYCMSEF